LLEDALRDQQRTVVPAAGAMTTGNGSHPAARVKMLGY
jgi:hypothetical protein